MQNEKTKSLEQAIGTCTDMQLVFSALLFLWARTRIEGHDDDPISDLVCQELGRRQDLLYFTRNTNLEREFHDE